MKTIGNNEKTTTVAVERRIAVKIVADFLAKVLTANGDSARGNWNSKSVSFKARNNFVKSPAGYDSDRF